jgi:HEAT repeat protein
VTSSTSPAAEPSRLRSDAPPANAGEQRRRAAIAGHTGDAQAARELLGHPDGKVRATALGALNRLGALEESELLTSLQDPDPAVRRRACEEATRWNGGTDDPLPALVGTALTRRLFDEDDTVIETAAWACGERPPAPPDMLDRLIEVATDHEDALCREAAVASLGALGDPRGLPAILTATNDRATVRRRAVIALAPFEGPEVDAALETARTDRDWQVRQAAEDHSP